MEVQVKTAVCPNCGANATNLHNCEYCGSMLVRCYDAINTDANCKENNEKEVLKLFGKSAYTHVGLCKRVKNIINLSQKYQTEITGDVYVLAADPAPFLNWQNNITVISNATSNTLKLVIKFKMSRESQNKRYLQFEESPFSKLFTIEQKGSTMHCSMEIDKNEETAAKFTKYIVENIFEWTHNDFECCIYGNVGGSKKEFVSKRVINELKRLESNKEKDIRKRKTYIITLFAGILLICIGAFFVSNYFGAFILCLLVGLTTIIVSSFMIVIITNFIKEVEHLWVETRLSRYKYGALNRLLSEE